MPVDAIPGYDPAAAAGDCRFDRRAARRAADFFRECLTLTAGEWRGRPFLLQPWQKSIVFTLFGWKRPDGRRRYREAFVYVPRKNGKSEWAGGLSCLLTFADGEPAAQVYCAAADRDQARLVFGAARTMVEAEPELTSRSKVYTHAITAPASGSVLKVISAEAYSKHGINAHGIIIDELHAQPNRDLVDVLTTSTAARRQPLIIHITTADFDRESICNEKYDYACKVRDGVIDDPAFLPVIYEAQPDEDWTDPKVWRRVNPNLGVSVSMEYLERECRKAQDTPSYENTFKRLHLNLRTQQDVRWLSLEAWDACDGSPIDESALAGRECWAGLDLSTTTDLSALVLVFLDEDDGTVTLLPRFWMPADNAEKRERRDRVPYLTWARQGFVEMTPGNVIDYERIKSRIDEMQKRFNIHEIAIDRWNATQITTQLQGEGHSRIGYCVASRELQLARMRSAKREAKARHSGGSRNPDATVRTSGTQVCPCHPHTTTGKQVCPCHPSRELQLARISKRRPTMIGRETATQNRGMLYEVVAFDQGYRDMSAPTKEFEKLVISGKLRHGGHPVLRWMVSHVSAETDAAGNLKPSKKKSTERIDGLVAAIMALGRWLVADTSSSSSFEKRGLYHLTLPE
jgi:phage terminase large subunit-like protein